MSEIGRYLKLFQYLSTELADTVAWRYSVKKVLLKISQSSQETPVSESLF